MRGWLITYDFFLVYTFWNYTIQIMSNLGRRQLAPNERAFKYEFTLKIIKFKCEVPLPCTIRFMWKRNTKSIETKTPYEVAPGIVELVLDQTLSSISTIVYNTDRREFLGKQSEIVVNMYFSGSPKKLASCQIDMKSILDPTNFKQSRPTVFQIPLNLHIKTVSKDNKISLKLSCIFKEEIFLSQKSIGNALNSSGLSGLSIPQDNKFFEKRYEAIPSKDCYSVTSYNTGIRYPSATKRERDDSSSIRKYQYGFVPGMKKNINNDQDSRSKAGFKSIDNKTEMNDGSYQNRQLIDEQNKRSKAEAELTKNYVQISELKKKLNELAIDNLKLKQELGKVQLQRETSSKEINNQFQYKLYEANNELRQVKNQFETKRGQCQRLMTQINKLKNQKSYFEFEMQNRQKKIEELQRNQSPLKRMDSLAAQNQDLKYQIQNIRRFIDETKRQSQDKQNQLLSDKYRQTQQLNTKIESLRKQLEQSKSSLSKGEIFQKKLQQGEQELMSKCKELNYRTSINTQLEKDLQQYKIRISQYETEKLFMQREIVKFKMEINDRKQAEKNRGETQAKIDRLYTQNNRLTEQIYNLQMRIQDQQKLNNKSQLDKSSMEGKSKSLLQQINDVQRRLIDTQNQNNTLRSIRNKLMEEKEELAKQNEKMKTENIDKMNTSANSSQMDQLFRQSLQMQVQLKFANDQLTRLRLIQQSYENEKWRADKEESDRLQIQKDCQRIEKELMNKNRSLLIEVEKTKMMTDQLNQHQYNSNLLREELERSRNIIYNGEQQVTEMQQSIQELQGGIKRLQTQKIELQSEKHQLLVNNGQVKQLQNKIRELQQRNAEKLSNIENMNKSLQTANVQIKELQKVSEGRRTKLINTQKQIQQTQLRNKQIEKSKTQLQSDMAKLLQEKRLLEKRNQMIMVQIHGMKKRFEEEKGRSLTITRNQELNRVRTLESEVERRQKTISKLNKEKLELQEENVRINVQVMKLLSQLEREKAKGNMSNHPSLKVISSFK